MWALWCVHAAGCWPLPTSAAHMHKNWALNCEWVEAPIIASLVVVVVGGNQPGPHTLDLPQHHAAKMCASGGLPCSVPTFVPTSVPWELEVEIEVSIRPSYIPFPASGLIYPTFFLVSLLALGLGESPLSTPVFQDQSSSMGQGIPTAGSRALLQGFEVECVQTGCRKDCRALQPSV